MKEKPTVVIAADTYYPKVDGVLIFVEEFMKRSKEQFSLQLIVPKFDSEKKIPEIETTFLSVAKRVGMFNYKSIKFTPGNLSRIKKVIQNADLVFIQELAPVGILALHYARRFGKKKVLYVHNTPWEFLEKYYSLGRLTARIIRRYYISLYNKADLLLVPYSELKSELEKVGISAPIEVARLGVDIERFKPAEYKAQSKKKMNLPQVPIIGYVGRISYEKNPLVLLRAFKRLKQGFLLMVGDGNKDLVAQFRKTKNCIVTGFVRNVEDYLQAMDVFVMPSLTETTSLATLEAMSTGLPVVTSKVGFLKSYIVKDHNGLFFSKNNTAMLALKLEKLLLDQSLREKLGENARKTVVYSFSWERSVERISQLLSQQITNQREVYTL